MTTTFFVRVKQGLRGSPRAQPVPAPVQWSAAQGIMPTQVGAPTQTGPPTPVSLEKKPADLETIGLGSRASFITTPQIDAHGTSEEKVGPRAVPASLVGGL